MANKFYEWCENSANYENATTFGSDSERTSGFIAGTPAKSIKVNTALRQANLIACALTDILIPNDTTNSLESTRANLKTALDTGLTDKIYNTRVAAAESLSNGTDSLSYNDVNNKTSLRSQNFASITDFYNYLSTIDNAYLSTRTFRIYVTNLKYTYTKYIMDGDPNNWTIAMETSYYSGYMYLKSTVPYKFTQSDSVLSTESSSLLNLTFIVNNAPKVESNYMETDLTNRVIKAGFGTVSGNSLSVDSITLHYFYK